jgi:hypothetical protein
VRGGLDVAAQPGQLALGRLSAPASMCELLPKLVGLGIGARATLGLASSLGLRLGERLGEGIDVRSEQREFRRKISLGHSSRHSLFGPILLRRAVTGSRQQN